MVGKNRKQTSRAIVKIVKVAVIVALLAMTPLLAPVAQAAPTVAITSPTAGQNLASGPITVTGTATANRTVQIFQGAKVLAATIADGAGNWSVNVTGLTNGAQNLTAKVIENGPYGYFGALSGSNSINRFALSSNAVAPGSGYPVAATGNVVFAGGLYGSPIKIFTDVGGTGTAPMKFDMTSPADPVATSGYPAASTPYAGDFNATGTKFYTAIEETGEISVIDVATNTQTGTIAFGGTAQSIRRAPSGLLYASDTTNDQLKIINTTTDTVVDTIAVSCPTSASIGAASFPPGEDFYFLSCAQDGIIKKYSLSSNTLITNNDISASMSSISSVQFSADSLKMYVSGVVNIPGSDKLAVVDVATGAVDTTIQLTAETFSAILSPDYQYLYAATPGAGFSTTNIDVISTATNSVVDTIDTSALGLPGIVFYDDPQIATASVNFAVGAVGSQAETLSQTGDDLLLIGWAIGGLLFTVAVLSRAYRTRSAYSRRNTDLVD